MELVCWFPSLDDLQPEDSKTETIIWKHTLSDIFFRKLPIKTKVMPTQPDSNLKVFFQKLSATNQLDWELKCLIFRLEDSKFEVRVAVFCVFLKKNWTKALKSTINRHIAWGGVLAVYGAEMKRDFAENHLWVYTPLKTWTESNFKRKDVFTDTSFRNLELKPSRRPEKPNEDSQKHFQASSQTLVES